MIAPKKIRYRNKTNIDYDVIVDCIFGDGDSGETETYLNREAIISETYDGSYVRNHGYKYGETLVATVTFIKKDFSEFTQEENRRMLSWLTSARNAERLEIYHDDSEVVSYVLFGGWTSVQAYKMNNSCVLGYVCEFSHMYPYALSPTRTAVPERIIVSELNDEPFYYDKFIVTCKTDEDERPVYPKITITFDNIDNDENVTSVYTNEYPMSDMFEMMENVIYKWFNSKTTQYEYYVNIAGSKGFLNIFGDSYKNQNFDANTNADGFYYDRETRIFYEGTTDGWVPVATMALGAEIKITHVDEYGVDTTIKSVIIGCDYNEVITIDGANKLIFSSRDTATRVIGDDFNWEWPRFVYGENTVSVVGNCSMKFEWVEPRKVGQL